MNLKTKLVVMIGVLFAMIMLLGGISVSYIYKLDGDTQNILADNNNSLDYSRNMLSALEQLPNDVSALALFESHLQRQQKNITEKDEEEATQLLTRHFNEYRTEPNAETLHELREDLVRIMGLNMSSIYRKSEIAASTAEHAVLWISILFILCLLISILLFIYFPKSLLKPVEELTGGIMDIANRNYNKRLHFDEKSEFGTVALSFNKMAECLEEYEASTVAKLLTQKKYIEAIVNSITEPLIGLNNDLHILFVNDEALSVLNLKREDVINRPAVELSLRNDLLRRLIRELVNPEEKHETLKIYTDDKESYFQAQYIPVILPDSKKQERIGDLILLKNVTEFKELDSAKTTFISTISHELKTPLAAIMMSLQLLEDNRVGKLNEEQSELSQSIKENGERLLTITGELLKLTQVEAGKLFLNPKITKPIELINYAIAATRVQADKFGTHIEVDYPEKISKLFVDSEKIAWVITNLLSNAIHYSPENGRVIIGAKQHPDAVEIYVQDFGKGIDVRYHKSIFDKYFRVPGTKTQGSGLGLSISKEFVEAHNGALTVESEIGKGSRFMMIFKLQK